MAGEGYEQATQAAVEGTGTPDGTGTAVADQGIAGDATQDSAEFEGQDGGVASAAVAGASDFNPQQWGLKYRDQTVFPKDRAHLVTLAQQGFGATQRLSELNRREAQLKAVADKYAMYDQLEKGWEGNPAIKQELAALVSKYAGQQGQQGQQQQTPQGTQPQAASVAGLPPEVQQTIKGLRDEIAQLKQVAQVIPQMQQRWQTIDEREQDTALKGELEALKANDKYKGFDWATDSGDGALNVRVMKRALELGGVPLETALKDIMWDAQRTNVEASTLQNVAEQTRQNRKAGIVQGGRSAAPPPPAKPKIDRTTDYRALAQQAAADPLMGG